MDINREQIVQIFAADSEENLRKMEEALIRLETNPEDEEILQTIFRVAHTLKGDSATLGFMRLAEFAHVAENVLDQLRKGKIRANSRLISTLLKTADVFGRLVQSAVSGKEEDVPVELHAVLEQLNNPEAVAEYGEARAAEKDVPSKHSDKNRTVRVEIEKLDRLLDLTGEIAVARSRFEQAFRTGFQPSLLDLLREADALHLEMQDLVTKVRMLPIGPTFSQFDRTIRDLSLSQGKMARLVVEGEDAEIDMKVIEHLKAPLVHMIRNAVDHGIERPEERVAGGKHPCGNVILRALHEGGSVIIQVEDDGKGLDREKMIQRARSLGILKAEEAPPKDAELHRWIFLPGFSTSDTVTEVSGRGVGMDVVKRNIEELRGVIDICSSQGKGVCVSIRLPLTLALIEGFAVGVEQETYIIPMDTIVECMEMTSDTHPEDASGLVNIRGELLPYLRLRKFLGMEAPIHCREHAIVVQYGGEKAAIVVDRLQGQTQVVIKPIGPFFRGVKGLAGSAILGNGKIALILDVSTILTKIARENTVLAETA